jgi:beta-carotene hydroxylase
MIPEKHLLTSPRVAWPTLALFAAALSTWILAITMGVTAGPRVLAVVVAALGAYAAFTPLHEAAHRSVARARWVSEVIGRIASVPLMGPFPAVRYFHLEHHKHTNDAAADPDHWSGRGPFWALPLRWLTQDLHYYWRYAMSFTRRPMRERLEVVVTGVLFAAVILAACVMGHGRDVLLFWVLPARIAVLVLAFAFDWLPHRPHQVTSKEDRYRATSAFEGRLLFVALLGQSLHLVHHLYPGVPFYRYGRVWLATGRASGARAR